MRSHAVRRVLALLITLALLVVLNAAAASASTFGSWFYVQAAKFGGFVNLGVPSSTFNTDAHEFVLHRNFVQTAISASAGLEQVGYYTSGSAAQLDNCGTTGEQEYKYFLEWRQPNGSYNCHLYGDAPSYPSDCPGSVAALTNSNSWDAILGCSRTDLGSFDIGASTGYSGIGGEINGLTDYCSSTNGGYGYNGDAWNVYFHSDRGSPGAVLDPSTTDYEVPNSNWNLPNIPTPISITHPPICP